MQGRIIITGVSGFIGSNLANKLAWDNNQVSGLVRKPVDYLDKRINLIQTDILNPSGLVSIFKNCDILYHCAAHISFQASDFEKSYQINVEGTRNVLEAAYQAGVKKIVHLSACAVLGYSDAKEKIIDENASPPIPKTNVYAYTKMKSEEIAQEYVKKGLNISIANIATVYGWGDRRMNSGSIIKAIYLDKAKFLPPGGTSYVAVNDLVDGLMLLAEKGRSGERYIFCDGNLTFYELFNRISKLLNKNEIKFILPGWTYPLAMAAAYMLSALADNKKEKINLITPQIIKESYHYKYYSSLKARDELGWVPKKSLEDAVIDALEFYKKEKLI